MIHSIYEINRSELQHQILLEYFEIKDKYSDCIVLFQLGHFFETFFEDAKIVSDITGITLGSRSFAGIGEIVQAGFNIKGDLYSHIKHILAHDLKICVCPVFKDKNGNVLRKVERIYTSGTIIESELLEATENSYIAALYKENNNVKLAYADVSTGQFYLSEGTLTEVEIEIEKIEAKELLILDAQKEFFKTIAKKNNTTFLIDKSKSAQDIIENYCAFTQKSFQAKLNEPIKYEIKNYLSMDEVTRRNLELTRTKRYLKKKGSLFWFLKYTKTPMGTRLLKKYIDEPLLDVEKIKKRQEAVSEFVQDVVLLEKLEDIMQDFSDLSRSCTKISNQTIYPKDLYIIAQNSQTLTKIMELCEKLDSALLKLSKTKINEIVEFAGEIKKAIKKDASEELKSGGIILDGYCANLDFLRNELLKCENEIKKYQESESKRLNIKSLKILKSGILGFYIEITSPNVAKISKDYLKKQTLTNCSRYTTEKLQNFEIEYSSLKHQINQLEYELYCEIRSRSIYFVDIIRDLAHEIAQIDVIASLARCAIDNKLMCPKFNCDEIQIKNGFHPSLIKLNNEIVKNDTNIKNGATVILTGANMSGKSTYLKYNAIIVLLSQIGAFVPAEYASTTIIDKIFVRQGSTDDIINNNSSFMVEMNDLKHIVDNVTDSSLIILDEPAKSTSAKEGGAIARAFCEYILKNYKAKTIVATHNLELAKIETMYPDRAFNYVIGNSDISETEINDRKIKRGVINSSLAINTAALADLPLEIISAAKKYALV